MVRFKQANGCPPTFNEKKQGALLFEFYYITPFSVVDRRNVLLLKLRCPSLPLQPNNSMPDCIHIAPTNTRTRTHTRSYSKFFGRLPLTNVICIMIKRCQVSFRPAGKYMTFNMKWLWYLLGLCTGCVANIRANRFYKYTMTSKGAAFTSSPPSSKVGYYQQNILHCQVCKHSLCKEVPMQYLSDCT